MSASDGDVIVYGSGAAANELVVGDGVESRHCRLKFEPTGCWIEDLATRTGTFVNGQRVSERPIVEGDTVTLGATTFIFDGRRLKRHVSRGKTAAKSLADAPKIRSKRPSENKAGRPSVTPKSITLFGLIVLVGLIAIVALTRGPRSGQNALRAAESSDPVSAVDDRDSGSGAIVTNPSGVDLYAGPRQLEDLVKSSRRAVVRIECFDGDWFHFGSGWPLDRGDQVVVVTNHHIIEDCTSYSKYVQVFSGNKPIRGEIDSTDPANDLAIITVDDKLSALPTAGIPEVGHWAMAVGNPEGLERSVNYGSVTNYIGRASETEGGLAADFVTKWGSRLIITDAVLNPGNSGGPLINSAGSVIGINTGGGGDSLYVVLSLQKLCDKLIKCKPGQWVD